MKNLKILWALTRFYIRVIPRDWYRRPPFLPAPPAAYVRWRVRTAYGKQRPAWTVVLHDLWQFGDWLRTFGKNG